MKELEREWMSDVSGEIVNVSNFFAPKNREKLFQSYRRVHILLLIHPDFMYL